MEQLVAKAAAVYLAEGVFPQSGWLTLISDLVRTLPWPSVVFFFIWYFRKEIKLLLGALPAALERLRSAKMPGVELTLMQVEQRLSIAEQEAKGLQLPPGEVPQVPQKKDDSQRG